MKGILFKPEMIQAIIEGRKTQTRRIVKPEPANYELLQRFCKPRYQIGETVYAKEAWCESYYGEPICYKLDGKESPGPKGFWRSPMFLKAINARYFITITDVRAERLQEITPEDAVAEGAISSLLAIHHPKWMAIDMFKVTWNSINKDYPWEMNPWVFRYEFEYQSRVLQG